MNIDSYHHFWKNNLVRDTWINQSMSVTQKDLLLIDLESFFMKIGLMYKIYGLNKNEWS